MNLESIVAIAGKSGLYKVVSQIKNGFIVESILDKKRMPVLATEKVSTLSDISIYTNDGDMPLSKIYDVLYKKKDGKSVIDSNAKPAELKAYMKEVLPDYDEERVYNSNLKKLFKWFNILAENGLLVPDKEGEKEEGGATAKLKKVVPKKTVMKQTVQKTRSVKGGGQTSMPSKKGA